jgi:hypothetical protein
MRSHRPDPTATQVIAATASDASVTIPIPKGISNSIGNPEDTGSEYYISVDGNPVAINYGGAAVFPTTTGTANPILEVGMAFYGEPVNIPPGTVVHAICASGKTAFVSIIRARRTS